MKLIVYVKPNCEKESFVMISDNEAGVALKEPAYGGKANLALVKLLARKFKVPQKNVKIKNPRSRKKVVEIVDGKI